MVDDAEAACRVAEDVDEDTLHRRVGEDDLERRRDLLLRGAAADVEEVGRLGAFQLDDVHRRHGQAGAVDHAADRPVELDVRKVVFGRLDLHRVFLGEVAQLLEVRVAEAGIAVEADLGVEHQQPALVVDRQRIDLDLRRIGAEERLVEAPSTVLACLTRSPDRPSAAATARPWCGISPVAGSMVIVAIFSGLSWATFSISIPPSVEATTAMRPVSRSTSSAR